MVNGMRKTADLISLIYVAISLSRSPYPPYLSLALASDLRPSASAQVLILRRKIKSEGYNLNPKVKTDLLNALLLAAQRFNLSRMQLWRVGVGHLVALIEDEPAKTGVSLEIVRWKSRKLASSWDLTS
ncbi:uncharacterized protein LOC144553777 [Carex rostrata]